uniref:Zinc finger protein 385B-like isoform X2 n=1 Tax=Hirondellea gigas TaxID=1518452 RepID=A0A6A7FTB3_9CRUS
MEVVVHNGLTYQLQILQLNLLQQQQQAYIPVTHPHYLYQELMMSADEKAESPAAAIAAAAAAAVVVNQNDSTEAAIAYVAEMLNVGKPRRRSKAAKEPPIKSKCVICDLEFASQVVLDSHNAGSKHQKKVKSAELMKSMEPMQDEFVRDEVSGVIRCTVCDITVNSPQLLATHMAGNKHRNNAAKRSRTGDEAEGQPPSKRPCVQSGDDATAEPGTDADTTVATATSTTTPAGKKKKKKKKKKKTSAESSTDPSAAPISR